MVNEYARTHRWERLPRAPDAQAERYQTIELPPMRPYTVEHRRHCVTCPHCTYVTMASYAEIPTTPFGPRLAIPTEPLSCCPL